MVIFFDCLDKRMLLIRDMSRVFIMIITCSLGACSFFSPENTGPPPPPLNEREKKIVELMSSLPQSPNGYWWIFYQGVALSTPSSWLEYKNNKIFISTPKTITKSGYYELGVSIQTLKDIKKNSGVTAEAATIRIIKILEAQKTNKRLMFYNRKDGGHKVFSLPIFR